MGDVQEDAVPGGRLDDLRLQIEEDNGREFGKSWTSSRVKLGVGWEATSAPRASLCTTRHAPHGDGARWSIDGIKPQPHYRRPLALE